MFFYHSYDNKRSCQNFFTTFTGSQVVSDMHFINAMITCL